MFHFNSQQEYDNTTILGSNIEFSSSCPLDIRIGNKVQSLSLYNCQVKSINIPNKNSLTKLILAKNMPKEFNFARYKKLKELHCMDTNVTQVPNLKFLEILKSNVLVSLRHQERLKDLTLSGSPISKLPNLPKLEYLICDNTNIQKPKFV